MMILIILIALCTVFGIWNFDGFINPFGLDITYDEICALMLKPYSYENLYVAYEVKGQFLNEIYIKDTKAKKIYTDTLNAKDTIVSETYYDFEKGENVIITFSSDNKVTYY